MECRSVLEIAVDLTGNHSFVICKFCVRFCCDYKRQDHNTNDIPQRSHTRPLHSVNARTVHTLFPSVCSRSVAALYSSSLIRHKVAVAAVLLSSSDWNRLHKDILSHMQTTSTHMRRDQGVGRMCQHLPAPKLHQILHATGRCCAAISWSKTTLVQVFYVEQPVQPLAKVRSNIGHWPSYQLARNFQAEVYFSWRTWSAWPAWLAVQLSFPVTFGHAFQHSVISAEGQMNAAITTQQFKYDPEMHCLLFSNAAYGCWQEHAWLFGHRWARMESTLHELFFSPGCWWGYYKYLLRLRSRTDFTSSCGLHPSPILGLRLEGYRLSFPAVLMAFTHRQRVSYEEVCVPATSLKDL